MEKIQYLISELNEWEKRFIFIEQDNFSYERASFLGFIQNSPILSSIMSKLTDYPAPDNHMLINAVLEPIYPSGCDSPLEQLSYKWSVLKKIDNDRNIKTASYYMKRSAKISEQIKAYFNYVAIPVIRHLKSEVMKISTQKEKNSEQVSPSPQNSSNSLLTSSKITRYVLEEEYFGEGGFGVVFKARDSYSPIPIYRAIKVLIPYPGQSESKDGESRSRFEREIEATSKLKHPYIVSFITCGYTEDDEEYPYIVMEYIEGQPLSSVKSELSHMDRIRLIIQVLEAMDYAHKNDVLHRDIKPSNIMYDSVKDCAVVVDFGLAYIWEGLTGKSLTRDKIGSDNYIPPEVKSNPKLRNKRHDIYSIGITLFEVMFGFIPDILDIKSFSEIDEKFKGLDSIVKKALAKSSDRYPTIEEFLGDLKNWYKYQLTDLESPEQEHTNIQLDELKDIMGRLYINHPEAPEGNIAYLLQYFDDLKILNASSLENELTKNMPSYLKFEESQLEPKPDQVVALLGTLAINEPEKLTPYYTFSQELNNFLGKQVNVKAYSDNLDPRIMEEFKHLRKEIEDLHRYGGGGAF